MDGYLMTQEFSERSGLSVSNIRKRIAEGAITKVRKQILGPGRPKLFIHESEVDGCKKGAHMSNTELALNVPDANGELDKGYMSLRDFAHKSGFCAKAIKIRLRSGVLKKAKKVRIGKIEAWMIHRDELAPMKTASVVKRGSYFSGKPHVFNVSDLPHIDGDVDVTLDEIANFVPERGKFPYKNLCAAVKMALQRKEWNDIVIETGVPKKHVLLLIDEFKRAVAAEPKAFPTLMVYLNAGRPYNSMNRDMLKPAKGARNGKH